MGVSVVRRALFALVERVVPGVDRGRIVARLDMESPAEGEIVLEERLARAMSPHARGIAVATSVFFLAAVSLVYGAAPRAFEHLRDRGHPGLALLVPLGCGMLVHGLFVLVVHEATHGNLFGHPADGWAGNAALGALLLPFLAEKYQHTHRVHHKLANLVGDPTWTPFRQRLFTRSRVLYAVYELVPIVNNLDRLREKSPRDLRKVALAWIVALAVLGVLRPGLVFVLLVYTGLNTTNAVRLWTEHFGRYRGRISNVYACPLGFGIGNHALHHASPRIPALALMIGLWLREKDASMVTAPYHLLFSDDYRPFRTFMPDFDGTNV